MPTISITVSTNDWTRIKPALRSAYGPALDPDALLSDTDLANQSVRYHVQQMVKEYERVQAEAGISIPDLD